MLVARSKWGKGEWPLLLGYMWYVPNSVPFSSPSCVHTSNIRPNDTNNNNININVNNNNNNTNDQTMYSCSMKAQS